QARPVFRPSHDAGDMAGGIERKLPMFVQSLIRLVAMEQYVVHPEVTLVIDEFSKSHDAHFFQVLKTVAAPAGIVHHLAQWSPYPLEHGIENVLLVAEVPVNRTPGNTGCAGNFLQ